MAYRSVRAALASLRGLVARYRGDSNVPRRDRVHGDRWRSSSHSQHNGETRYQRYQLKYQQAQQRPPVTTQGHQSTTKRPVKFTVTPHALKLQNRISGALVPSPKQLMPPSGNRGDDPGHDPSGAGDALIMSSNPAAEGP